MLDRRKVIRTSLGLLTAGMTGARADAPFPSRPIRLLVGYTPGGGADIVARALQPALERQLGGTVLVDNMPGVAGNVAANHVSKSVPDGYTLLLGTNASNAISASFSSNLAFNPRTGFTPIALLAKAPEVISVSAKSPFRTVEELVSFAKANPGKLSYPSPGYGSAPHLAAKFFETITGTRLVHVPFRGGGQSITEIMAGRVDVSFDSVTTILPFVGGGLIRPLAVASREPVDRLPDVATAVQAGIPEFTVGVWFGLFAPPGLPPALAERLNMAVVRCYEAAEFRQQLTLVVGVEPLRPRSMKEFSDFVASEIDRYQELAKGADLKRE